MHWMTNYKSSEYVIIYKYKIILVTKYYQYLAK